MVYRLDAVNDPRAADGSGPSVDSYLVVPGLNNVVEGSAQYVDQGIFTYNHVPLRSSPTRGGASNK